MKYKVIYYELDMQAQELEPIGDTWNLHSRKEAEEQAHDVFSFLNKADKSKEQKFIVYEIVQVKPLTKEQKAEQEKNARMIASALETNIKGQIIIGESGDGVRYWQESKGKPLKYGMREHRGGLKESLATSKYISKEEFEKLKEKYKWYGYDHRCRQNLFIAKNIEKEKYTWLFIEG